MAIAARLARQSRGGKLVPFQLDTENALLAGGVWLALTHPLVTLAVGVVVLALALVAVVWLGGRALRALRGIRVRARARAAAR